MFVAQVSGVSGAFKPTEARSAADLPVRSRWPCQVHRCPTRSCRCLTRGVAGNIGRVPEAEVRIIEIKALKTRSGNTRFVVVDEGGKEYSTFKESVAAGLPGLEGKRARIEFHEQERNGFTNVYLDAVEPLEKGDHTGEPTVADEVAWKTAIDAAPYLLSSDAVEREVPPEELFEKLQPFKEMVADDIDGTDSADDAIGGTDSADDEHAS